ncbi:hypothetical protein WICPIJ_001682 [Wickerhamomyces pijperi]|uniref:Uncharacterized protein n=1 Tax=Wickerhamomyces pijperi TaxID=599730 RepID=A0A9P8QAH3_WICPI|nr:hypothetical protein WICPIJ_001682 [Wickerhamomyces pijperi]
MSVAEEEVVVDVEEAEEAFAGGVVDFCFFSLATCSLHELMMVLTSSVISLFLELLNLLTAIPTLVSLRSFSVGFKSLLRTLRISKI